MTSTEIRKQFLDFFQSKQHQVVPSAPIVIKNDPTLLFTNAGMNQFKDYFLGNKKPEYPRIADTQKCLRVSGKHNDLEEVGVDTYHHTMFEMLGNWSFGDYFKNEAIAWSWELLTEVLKLDKDRLYVTIFEGDEKEGLPADEEAATEWKKWIAADRILPFAKKDNFWEMGDTGPCGPCTEIHVDGRSDEERKAVDGQELVNKDHPQVIEIWNNVFIQFNRLKDGRLEPLPARHVDTGMGFERLVRVIQQKQSNYDTDVFSGTIEATEKIINKKYGATDSKQDIAFRVIADHIRAIAFTIADGQLPSNTGAGYVIRRVLRRAVRYYYSYLDYKQPLLYQLIPVLAKQFENVFPELQSQAEFVSKVVREEEDAFLRTLESGISLFNQAVKKKLSSNEFKTNVESVLCVINDSWPKTSLQKDLEAFKKLHVPISDLQSFFKKASTNQETNFGLLASLSKEINNLTNEQKSALPDILNKSLRDLSKLDGSIAFKLQDTFGFPKDLTELMAQENGLIVDEEGFQRELQQQKNRSRSASIVDTEDWIVLDDYALSDFVGYDNLEIKSKVVKYRKVKAKGKEAYQLVLEATPFYAESGGQVGDKGSLIFGNESIQVFDTKKENNLIIHFTETLPANISGEVFAKVDQSFRKNTEVHHSATHLLHAALRKVLGNHVAQKGSLVNDEQLRFDFSHFSKVSNDEIQKIEAIVNERIRENIPVIIKQMTKDEAVAQGAMALFGEKYGDIVRVVIIDPTYSIELCGGTHAGSTGELGLFKIKHETAVAAGVRRMEAVSGNAAMQLVNEVFDNMHRIRESLKNPKEIGKAIEHLQAENTELKKRLEGMEARQLSILKLELLQNVSTVNSISFIGETVEVNSADSLKKLCLQLKNDLTNYVVVLAANVEGKSHVALMLDDAISATKNLDAVKIIKEHIAPLIKGGGGGQKTLATAGGQDASNLPAVIDEIKSLL